MTEIERMAYESFNKRLRDIASENFTKEADYKFALQENYEKGVEKGFKKGIEKGELENTLKIVKSAIANGLDIHTISKITGLTIEKIKELLHK